MNIGLNSNRSLLSLISSNNNHEQEEKQNLGFTSSKRLNEKKKFYTAKYFNEENNIKSPFKSSVVSRNYNNNNDKDKDLFYKSSGKKQFNEILNNDSNEGFHSNKNLTSNQIKLKTAYEKVSNANSGLKIPKNFLKFNSDLFSDDYNHSKKKLIIFTMQSLNILILLRFILFLLLKIFLIFLCKNLFFRFCFRNQ